MSVAVTNLFFSDNGVQDLKGFLPVIRAADFYLIQINVVIFLDNFSPIFSSPAAFG
jgi:hypothetical protein